MKTLNERLGQYQLAMDNLGVDLNEYDWYWCESEADCDDFEEWGTINTFESLELEDDMCELFVEIEITWKTKSKLKNKVTANILANGNSITKQTKKISAPTIEAMAMKIKNYVRKLKKA